MQAVIHIGGSQLLVTEGQEILVNRLPESASKITINEVMMISDGGEVSVGKPYLESMVVTAERVADVKGDKVRTSKYKAKSRYRKVSGFRPQLTRLKILSIGTPKKSAGEKKS